MARDTIKRVFGSIRSIINIAIKEQGLGCSNAFSGTFMPEGLPVTKRRPIPIDDIRKIQLKCRDEDDELRWIIALLSDTGMRLGEAIGLLKSDIVLEVKIPHITLKPHPWRRLKTPGSERQIPLVGASLWAAKRALNQHIDTKFAFPKYCSDEGHKTNSASAALNNWSFDEGGRFYGGWWERVPSRYRSHITIDGMPTVEMNYAAIQPRLPLVKRRVRIKPHKIISLKIKL